MRKKKSHRAIYGLLGTVVAVTAIGNVAAKETKPYKAPELRLARGTEDYDLTEGITYDKGKYELMVEDTGDFDIEVLGKYTVEYSLTPLDEEDERYSATDNASKNEDPELDSAFQVGPEADKEETSSDSQAGSTKAASEESAASDGSAASEKLTAKAESTEASHYNKEDKKEASAAADLEVGKIGIAKTEKKGGFFTRLFARLSGFVHAAELDEPKAYALEIEAQDSAKDKGETGKADTDKAGKAEAKEPETSAAETKESEASEAETKEPESSKAETKESETKESESGKSETEETSAADSSASGQDSEANASATATSSNADGTLDEDDGIIYFDRIVRVVASDTGSNIEFDDPRLEIPSSAELFGIQIHGEFLVATDSNATPAEEDAKATNSNASKPSSDKEAADTLDEGFWVNENETDTENEAFSGDSDGATENGVEYTLVLKKPELLTGDAYFTDPDGKKLKKVEIKLKDAEELKDAVLVEENEKGVPVITGMELGTYTIELSAVDPDTEEEITCEREVEVVPSQRVKFDAPTLYIGTRNTSYDLTSGMVARDENGTEVTELYVVDETELLAAKEEVATASNANAETTEGQEEGENESQTENTTGTGLKKGIYHAVIGAKHPVTGEEFTVSRKVEVIDGYYIYAPVLEIRAGSTDYDLTSGAEVRDASGTEEKTVDGVAITIEDVSDLYRGVETVEDAGEDKAEEETTAGDENTADGIAAEQTDAAASYGFSAYALSLASEDAAGSETGAETGTEAADSAEAAAETETTGEFKTEKPALQEGTYMVTLSAVDPNTGEKIYMTRQVRVAARTAGLFSYAALNGTLSGTADTVALLPDKVTNWNDFLPTAGRPGYLRDGAAADVVLTANGNTNESDLLFGGYDNNVQGLDQDASISIDGNNNVFAKDKLKQPATYTDGGRKFDITIPAMQVELKNFVFDGLTGYPAYGTAAAIENQSSKIRMSEGSYLRLDNNKLELSSDFGTWSEADRAKYSGSRYGESGVDNADFYNRVSTTHMMILPVTGAEQKYDLSVVQGSTYSPRYLIKSPRNIIVDAANGVTSSPLAARNIGGNATVKLGNNGIAELYYLKGAQKTTVEGTGTIKFRTYYDALDRTTDYQDGISTQVLEVQDNVTFAKGVFGGRETGQPIIRITGDNGKIKLPNGKKITVARVANPATPGEHDGGLTKVLKDDVIATAEKTGVLNPLDFIIWGQTLPAIDSKDKYLYLELDSTGKKLTAVERDPIWKISISGESHTAYTFEQALDYLKDKTGGCVLTNSTDYTMTEEDIRALEQFSNTNVSINLEAGFKTRKTWDDAYGNSGNAGIVKGDYSYRLYVSSFPNQELNLPKNVDVLFEDVVFQFITKQNGPITIVGNGGTTTFRGETNYFYNLDNTRMKPILYGGTKNGKETGLKESILCFQPIVFSVYHSMGNSELSYKDARQYDAEFTSIYNFDELKFIEGPVGGNGLAGKGDDYGGTVSVERELNAQKDGILTKDGGYKGRITLATYYAQLVLKGRDAIHRAGSLQGNVNNTSNSGQIEIQGGAAEYPDGAGGLVTRSNVKNQYILTLTDEDPLCYEENINLPDMGLKIKRHENAANGEIAVYLPNVPDEKAQKYITTKWMQNYPWEFKAPFHSIKEDANGEKIKDYTIRWIGSGIYHYINVNTGWEANFITLEELLETMKMDEKTSPNGEYIISAYVLVDYGDQRFIMSSEDADALKKAVTTITTPKKITWTSAYDVNGERIERNRSALTLKTDFHFFGQESVVKEMHLRFDGNWNMYANGKPLTFDKELDIESYNANRANIFGGNKDGQGITNTHLTFNTDTEIFANIYGGSASGTCAANAVIDFKDGYGYAVYGGNKEGSHTGKASITIERKPNAEYNEILLVNGGSEKEPDQKKPEGKTVDIITRGNLKVKNLYNYDSLTVENGSLTIPNSDKAGEYNINAAFTEGYAGKTVLCDETTMQLLNYKGTRKMGSLTRAAQADLTDEAKQPKLVMKKADKDDAGHTASSKENKYLLELTAKDPFDMANFETNRKIKVSYDDAKSEAVGDVLFYLSDAAKAEQAADKPGIASLFRSLFRAKAANTGKTYYVTTKAINWQGAIAPIADESEKTIALPEPRVLLLDKSETVLGSYPDVAGAIVDIAAKEKQNNKAGDTYTIAVFKTDYTFTEADRLAAAYAAGKYTGDFDYNEKGHDLSTISNANIIWSGQYINDKATKTGNANSFRVVNPNGNFDFFGATTLVNNIKFNYDKAAATGRDLYANGSTITFGKEFRYKAGSAYANLYGGSKTTQAGGGTTKAGAQTDKIIKLEPRNGNDDPFYFQDIKDFTNLYVGNSGQTGGVRVKLMVTGKIDSDPDKAEGQKTGTVTLQNGWLRFMGTDEKASAEIGNLVSNGNAANAVTLVGEGTTADTRKTYYLKISGKTTKEVASQKIYIDIRTYNTDNQFALVNDVVVEYSDRANADENCYYSGYNSLPYVRQERARLRLTNSQKPLERIHLYKNDVKEGGYYSYADALAAIGQGDEKTNYTLRNIVDVEYTKEDQAKLDEFALIGKAASLTFEAAPYDANYGGTRDYNYYRVTSQIPVIRMPENRTYPITWNTSFYYPNFAKGKLELINNGGTLNFGKNFTSPDKAQDEFNIIVYGGKESGECSQDVSIHIQAGQFDAVYGGNKDGSHSGKVEIHVDCPTDLLKANVNHVKIKRLDGASKGEQQKPDKKTVTIKTQNDVVTGSTNELNIQNLYNYDTLEIMSGTLTIPNSATAAYNINASLSKGYAGKTVLADETTLKLLCYGGERKLGSIVRTAGVDVTKEANLYYNRPAGTVSDVNNKNLIELNASDPFGKDSYTGKQIKVSANSGVENDIVFKLTGIKDKETTGKKYITAKTLKSGFTMDMVSDTDNETIKLANHRVMLIDKNNNKSSYVYIADAIIDLAGMEDKAPGGTYTISIFANDYETSSDDLEAMEYAAGKKTGTFIYQGEEYTSLSISKAKTAAQITWSGGYDAAGTNPNHTNRRTYIKGDLNFFGKATELQGLYFNYTRNTSGKKDIYANGSSLTFNNRTWTEATNSTDYPSLYGGASAQADDKAAFGNITFRNNAANILKFQDIKGFKLLTVGNNGLEGTIGQSVVEVYGELKNEAPNAGADVQKASSSTAVQAAAEGDGTDAAPATKPDGSVYLKQGHLKLLGAAEPVITSMYADATGENKVTIPKKGSKAYPLKIAKETVLEKAENPIVIVTSVTESIGDVLAEYQDKNKAVAEQYKTNSAYTLTKAENKLVLEKKGSYYVKTSKGEEGIISELNSNTYDTLIKNTQTSWNYLYDHMDNQYKTNQMNPANDRTAEATHMLQYFKQGKKIEGKTQTTTDGQQKYDVYQWETAKTFLPAFAGQWDSFEWGSVEGGLSNQQLSTYWNAKSNPAKPEDYNNSYYYDSNRLIENNQIVGTKGGTKATWQGFGNGKGLYDWKTQEWLDDPAVTVRDLTKPYFVYPHSLTGHVAAFGSTISGWNEKESSLAIDFDSKGKNNTADFSNIGWCTLQPQGQYPGFSDYGQLSIKNVTIGGGLWNGGVSGKYFNIYSDYKVIRLDGWVGNGQGWYFDKRGDVISQSNVLGFYAGKPNSVIQIKLSDVTTHSPAYEIGASVGRVMVKAGKMIPDVDMVIYGVRDSVQIDTGDGGVVKLLTITPGTDKATLEFKGTGMISMTKFAGYGYWNGWSTPYMWGSQTYGDISAKANILHLMNDGVTFLSGNQSNLRINHVDSDGYRLNAGASNCYVNKDNYYSRPYAPVALTENYSFAEALKSYTEVGMLDATDFRLKLEVEENSATKVLNKPGLNGLYLTQDMNGDKSRIMVKKFTKPDNTAELLEYPLQLKKDDAVIDYYDSYKEAFAQMNDGNGNYTITNLVEWNFEKEDVDALAALDDTKAASITFEGGERPKGKTDGKAGSNYRLRLRKQTLTMPKNVDIAFKNIALKYDQGINKELAHENEVIIGNGGELTFDQVVFLKHADEDMAPIVYGGSETGKTKSFLANLFTRAAKPAVINVSGKYNFTSVYNYDQLNLKESANGTSLTVLDTLDAQKGDGYIGETKIANRAVLVLPNADGTKKIGTLKGMSAVTADETGAIQVARPKSNLGEAIPADNPAVLVLTGENPLESSADINKITVSYTDAVDDFGKPINNDVVMSLPNVPNKEAAARVTTQYLVDGFGGLDLYNNKIAMRAKPDNKTIVLQNASVGLTIGANTTVTPYTTLKDALDAIKANETNSADKGVDYRITFLVNGYALDEEDINAMKTMADTTAGQITWTSKIGADGQPIEVNNVVTVPDALNFFGKATVLENITMNYNGQQDIYANGIPMEVKSNVYMTGAAKPTLYGGSSTEPVNTTSLKINGGSFAAVYGGGKGFGADETSVVITAAQDGASVYGGSRNADTEKTNVSITVPNTADADAFSFADVSGFGTNDTDALAANVTGDAAVTIKQAQPDALCTTTITNLSGFTTLNLGDTAGAFDKQHFDITGRFDSKVTDEADGRTDTVNLNDATLITSGGSGHIGDLVSTGGSCLTVKKDGDTFPLLVDGNVTSPDNTRIKLKVKGMSTQLGDIMVTYTIGTNADNTLYVDGGNYNLSVVKAVNAADPAKADILFANPYAHTVEGEVEYDTTGNVDEAGNLVSKFMTFKYDATNPDHVLRGYVIPMPETKVGKPDSKKYTDMNTNYVINGTYDGGDDYPIYEIEWTRSTTDNSAEGRTKTVVPIQANTWYIAHIVCEENKHTYSFLVDVTAPRQVTGKDVAVNYNGATKTYTVSASFMDPTVEHMTQHPLPDAQTGVNAKLSYKSHGLVQYAWALGNTTGNAAADQAAKAKVMQADAAKAGIRDVENSSVADSDAGTYTFKVAKDDLKTGQDVVWIYVKDGVNNTVRLAVPMTDHMIDVTVPTRVSVVALKKSAASVNAAVPELLTPICYIRNNGDNKIKAEVSGFVMKDVAENEKDTSGLTLVDKEKGAVDFNTTELALFVKKDTLLTNVKKLAAQSDPVTGHGPMTLGEITKDSLLDFTFDAGYDPVNIVETTNWLTNEMSYHFSVVK